MPPAQVLSAGSRRRKEQRYRSVISDIFDGSILSLVQCLTCDRVSTLRWGGTFRLQPPQASSLGLGWGPGSVPETPAFPEGEDPSCRVPMSRS